MKAFAFILLLVSSAVLAKKSSGNTVQFAKVYSKGVTINSPATDPQTAQAEEKVRQIMKETNQTNYWLFNHLVQKEGLVYSNSLRLDLWNKIIEVRRENRRLGIFKINPNMNIFEVIFAILLVCGLILLLLLLGRKIQEYRDYVDEILLNSLVVITSDLLILIVILTVFNVIALYNVMIGLQMIVNIEQISVAGISLVLLWIGSSIVKLVICQLKVNRWDAFEAGVSDQLADYKEFAALKTKDKNGSLTSDEKKKMAEVEERIRYFNIRDDFIDPSYLPSVCESFYRSDFPFSDYLTICVGNTLKGYLKVRVWCYLMVLGLFLGAIFLVQTANKYLMLIIPMFICISASVVVILVRLHVGYILSQCAGNIKQEDMIEFTQLDGRNQGYRISAFPTFVSVRDDGNINLLGSQNRQECLFLFRNPALSVFIVKACELLVFSVVVITTPIASFFWWENTKYFWILVAVDLISIGIVMAVTPYLLCDYAVCTNIIMLRNKDYAREAIESQKKLLYERYRSVYRAIKMLNRQTGSATDPDFVKNSIHPLHKQQIQTVFSKISAAAGMMGRDRISVAGVRDVGYMLGQALSEEEWMVVAQEGLEEDETGGEGVVLEKVLACIEKMADDTKLDPYVLIRKLLVDASKNDEFINEEDQKVDIGLLRNYLSKHRFLDSDDRDIVLFDLSFLAMSPTDTGIHLDQLVSHMRNMLEASTR